MMQPQPMPAAPAVQQAPPQPQPQLDPQEIASETGFPVQRVMADIQASGAQTKEELYPAIYGNAGGIDPSVAQGGMGMPADDQSGQAGMAGPPVPPSQGPPTRMRAQAAMRGETMPDESEPAAESGMESMNPGAESAEGAEGIQPNIAAAAHSKRPVMRRAMKGKPMHHAAGKHRGRRV